MEIAFFEVYEDWEREELKQHFPKATFFKEKIQDVDTIILEKYDIISVFIYSKVSEDILSQLPNLKLLSTRSTGFDHIDMKYCESKNIDVITVSHYGENTVAEFTFALLVNISRKIMPSVTRVKSGSFDFSGLQGFDLVGKTIGLIGFGRIGQKFAKMCIGFEMKVKVFDVNSHMESLQNVGEILGVEFAELDEIYSSCDIISLHVPLQL